MLEYMVFDPRCLWFSVIGRWSGKPCRITGVVAEPFPAGPRLERLWWGGPPGCCSQVELGGDSWGSGRLDRVEQGEMRRAERLVPFRGSSHPVPCLSFVSILRYSSELIFHFFSMMKKALGVAQLLRQALQSGLEVRDAGSCPVE